VDATWLQRKRTTKEHMEKKSGEGEVESRLQVQLDEDGGALIIPGMVPGDPPEI